MRVVGGVVTVRYRRQPVAAFSTRLAKVALNGTIPWTIEINGGITDLTGTLAGVGLERLDLDGGANHVRLDLPRPTGTATVHIGGVVSSARLQRPSGVPVAVRLAGGVSRVRVDGARRKNVSGKQRYVGTGYNDSPDRYELEVLGGASEVTVSLDAAPESSGPADPSRDAGPCRVSGRFARPVDVRRAASPWPRRTRRPRGRPRCAAGSAG